MAKFGLAICTLLHSGSRLSKNLHPEGRGEEPVPEPGRKIGTVRIWESFQNLLCNTEHGRRSFEDLNQERNPKERLGPDNRK